MMKGMLLLSTILLPSLVTAFSVVGHARPVALDSRAPSLLFAASSSSVFEDEDLFVDEEEEMMPIAQNYLRAKYRQIAKSHGHTVCDADDVREVLRIVLPPVTTAELVEEVNKTLDLILKSDPENTKDSIQEDCFVKAILQNTYWRQAGSLVVKELIYFDALHAHYRTGESLLNNDDYEALKENLTWEGSSIASMKADEALFVTAVASARRGEPVLDDDEYKKLKTKLVQEDSWVTARQKDALEKLGIDTFLGYLHRSL
eukprot:scaffold2657_cov89-Amphora_coffeaeformis.AAC.3